MKQTQWTIAALVLAALVFGLTFAMNYLGGTAATTGPVGSAKPALELEFPLGKDFPDDPLARLEQEEGVRGTRDFWFVNRNDEPVALGLNKTNCRCTEVEAFVLPEDRQPAARDLLAGATLPPWSGWAATGAALRQLGLDTLKGGMTGARLKQEVESIKVPAGAVGFVRLHWDGERPGRASGLEANLWTDSQGSGKQATLSVRLTFYEAVRARLDQDEPSVLNDEDLQKGFTRTIYVWSSTREAFSLTAQLASSAGPSSDPVTISKPEPLTADERRELQRKNNSSLARDAEAYAGRVLSGYKITVTLNAWSADKTPFPVGLFARRVLLNSPEAKVHDKAVVIAGRVQGLVEVSGPGVEAGGIHLETFKRSAGKKVVVRLTSEIEGMKLEVDAGRTSKYLAARVSPDAKRKGDEGQRWQLHVEAKPGLVRGKFPRREGGYEDSAVYLLAERAGQPKRIIRLEVQGIASED